MKMHTGSCHCGAVAYTVNADITHVLECNCSHCYRKGFLLAFLPATQFTLHSGEDNLTEYRFNNKRIAHLFCKTCGVQCFGRGQDKEGNATVAVNVRTMPDIDVSALTVNRYNGKDV